MVFSYHVMVLSYHVMVLSYHVMVLSYHFMVLSYHVMALSYHVMILSYHVILLSYYVLSSWSEIYLEGGWYLKMRLFMANMVAEVQQFINENVIQTKHKEDCRL